MAVAASSPWVPPAGRPRFHPKYIPEITYPTPRPHSVRGPSDRRSSVPPASGVILMMMPADLARQALYAVLYYAALVLVMRLAGKRLAGQTTTFDLVVLIQLAVVLQMTLVGKGAANAAV